LKYDFDKVIDRTGTESLKWVFPRKVLGVGDAIPMWVADMDFEAPPEVVEAVARRAAHGIYGYPIVPPGFWESVIAWQRTRHGWEVSKQWLAKAPGVVPAVNFCVRALTRPGDGVVIQTPVYFPFFDAVRNNGRELVRSPLTFAGGRWAMDFEGLERAFRAGARMLILCSPHNPVGRVWTRAELERLGAICVKHDVLVVSDEIHAEIVFRGHRHVPFASLSPEIAARTVTCLAPSKTFNIPGLGMAVVIASNPGLLEAFKAESGRAGFELGQIFGIVGLEAAYRHGAEWLEGLLAYLEDNADFAAMAFAEKLAPLRFLKPEGTYLALLDCRDLEVESAKLDAYFLENARVYFNDGTIFGEELRGFVRMNFACPRSILREALGRIGAFLGTT
jgi:cystathionine beta-lyase